MGDDREQPARQVLGVVPALQLDLLGPLRVLAVGAGRVGVAAVGADQPVHHQLQRRGDLVPVDRRHDHDPVRLDPHRVDLVHPVLRLAQRVVRVAGAGPVAERRGGGEAGLAGVDVAAVLGGQPAQLQVPRLARRRAATTSRAISVSRNDLDISLGQVCSLRDEPLISSRRAGRPHRRAGPRRLDRGAGGDPVLGQVVGRVGEARPGLAGGRALALVGVGVPGRGGDPASSPRSGSKAGSGNWLRKRARNSCSPSRGLGVPSRGSGARADVGCPGLALRPRGNTPRTQGEVPAAYPACGAWLPPSAQNHPFALEPEHEAADRPAQEGQLSDQHEADRQHLDSDDRQKPEQTAEDE